jgi:hypothetical protein
VILHYQNFDFTFDEDDVSNPDDFIPAGDFNPHNIRPYILHSAGSVLAVAFSENSEDAMSEAADGGQLEGRKITDDNIDETTGDVFTGPDGNLYNLQDVDIIGVPPARWDRRLWTESQLQSQVADALAVIKGMGWNTDGLDRALSKLRGSLLELQSRKAPSA